MNPISYSEISLTESVPVSKTFDDPYFSREDGIAESTYIFLEHNYLSSRWGNSRKFVIAEFGFGTGLNFFLTANEWSAQAKPDQTLFYYSVEKFPIILKQLQQIHRQWPQFKFCYPQLYQYYPNALPGLHRIDFPAMGIVLCLMIGDVLESYSQLAISVDAWYLDGFAPAKNRAMWSEECFNLMANMSHFDTTFATYTAAGFVRRGLQNAGFEVNKAKGFGKKREMLCGQYKNNKQILPRKDPWFSVQNAIPARSINTVAVIGAGLAGLTTAWLLAKRGVQVVLIDKAPDVASGASGNPCGLVMPRFSNDFSLDTQFYYSSLYQTTQWLNELKKNYKELAWQQTGVIQLMEDAQLEKSMHIGYPDSFVQILTRKQVSDISALVVNSGGLYFPQAGYVSPKQLCQIMLQDINLQIDLSLNSTVTALKRLNNKWTLNTESGPDINVDAIVVANSYMAEQLLPGNSIKIEKNRGQLSQLNQATVLQQCKVPLVYDAYLTPALNGSQVLGASYAPDEQLSPRDKDHERNLAKLNRVLSETVDIDIDQLNARISFRAYSQDRMPVVGAVPDETFYRDQYADLHHGKRWVQYPDAQYHEGLYVTIGHGSRGLVSSLPSARLIADLITGGPQNMPINLINRLHPGRFLVRKLKKPN